MHNVSLATRVGREAVEMSFQKSIEATLSASQRHVVSCDEA